jgi:hypothetical protein
VLLPATGDPEFGIGGLFILWVLVTVLLGILIVAIVALSRSTSMVAMSRSISP